jgi:hypothetical protein
MSFQNGPVYVKDVFFDDFADNDYYHMGAIGFATVSKQSSMHSVENAQFGFSDVSLSYKFSQTCLIVTFPRIIEIWSFKTDGG